MTDEELKFWAKQQMERLIANALMKGFRYTVGVITLRAWNAVVTEFEIH